MAPQLTFEDFDICIPIERNTTTETLPTTIEIKKTESDHKATYASLSKIKKEFASTLRDLSHSRHQWEIWQDFVEMSAISLRQPFDFQQDREDKYLSIASKYNEKDIHRIPELLGLTIGALTIGNNDFLGQMFMELELSNKWQGQFFTPYPICTFMAKVLVDKSLCEQKEEIKLCEPCVGSGAMIMAFCEALREIGVNYQQKLYVHAQDISFVPVCMTYIQLSLIGCRAQVVHGDSLVNKTYDTWYTPFMYMSTKQTKKEPYSLQELQVNTICNNTEGTIET
jgi:type I restriction-modification system DNA methylase subunit